jgi:hypothetical protein
MCDIKHLLYYHTFYYTNAHDVISFISYTLLFTNSKLTEAIKAKKKIRVKMQSLLIKMINRLIREEIIPVEAVNVVTAETWIAIRCLVAPSAMPVIMLRCERIGVVSYIIIMFVWGHSYISFVSNANQCRVM